MEELMLPDAGGSSDTCGLKWPIVLAGFVTAAVVGGVAVVSPGAIYERNGNVRDYTLRDRSVLLGNSTYVFIGYGQSNADCRGAPGYTVRHPGNVYQFYDGDVYAMKEPMLGAFVGRGCIWPRLGDLIVDAEGNGTSVVFAVAAVPGAALRTLLPGTLSGGYFASVARALPNATILFQQGETDALAGTPPLVYKDMLDTLVGGFPLPDRAFRIASSTRCGSAYGRSQQDIAFVQRSYGTGPDLDTLGPSYRLADQCHFNAFGLSEAAAMWARALGFAV